jgi:hypothetical protein
MSSIPSAESVKTYGLLSESIPVYSSFGFIANRQQRSKWRTGPHQVRTFTVRLNNEIEALELCRGHESVRQLIDVIDSPQSIVLEYLHKNLYNESCERKLKGRDIKRAIQLAVFSALPYSPTSPHF